jgi:oxaloacetate decarboxylase alpha subunit
MEALLATAEMIRAEGGASIVAALTYSVSPVHTDEHYIACVRRLAQSRAVDAFYLKDPGGLLTPERAATLISLLGANAGTLPFEVHSHCTIGLAPFSYLEAARLGARALHVAVAPLANGTSQPSAERTIANLREQGHSVAIDDDALSRVCGYFRELAAAERLPVGQPQESAGKPFFEITGEEWDRVQAVNLKGAFLCAKVAFAHMRGRGGKIVNMPRPAP